MIIRPKTGPRVPVLLEALMQVFPKGADRTTGFPESLPVVDEMLAFGQAHRLWLSLQEGVKKFVKDNHGEATVLDPFSKRFKWSLVKRYLELNSNRGTIT